MDQDFWIRINPLSPSALCSSTLSKRPLKVCPITTPTLNKHFLLLPHGGEGAGAGERPLPPNSAAAKSS